MELFPSNADSYPCTTWAILQQFTLFFYKKWGNAVKGDENLPNALVCLGICPQGRARPSPAGRRRGLQVRTPATPSTPEQVGKRNKGVADSAQVLWAPQGTSSPALLPGKGWKEIGAGTSVCAPSAAAVHGLLHLLPGTQPLLPRWHSSLRRTVLLAEDLRCFPVIRFCIHLKQIGWIQFSEFQDAVLYTTSMLMRKRLRGGNGNKSQNKE